MIAAALWLAAALASPAAEPLASARALAEGGQTAEALATLRPLVDDNDPEATALAARFRLELGEVTRARQALEATLQTRPTADAHRDLARCYRALGDDEAALAQAAQAAQGGAEGSAELLVAALAQTRPAAAAEEILSGALDDAARNPARLALADAYTDAERHRDAAATWATALAAAPLSPEAPRWQASIAESHRRSGRMADEIAALEALLGAYGPGTDWARANPDRRDAADALASARLREALDRYTLDVQMMPQSAATTAALRELSRLYTVWLGRYPADGEAGARQQDYGALLARQGRYDEAIAQYEDAYRADPGAETAPEALRNVAHLAYRQMRKVPDEQKRWLRRLLWAAEEHSKHFADTEADAEVQWRAAEGLLLAERTDDALEHLSGVVDRWPETRDAERAARRILDVYIVQQDWPAARAAALRFQATPQLGDDAFKARVAEVIVQTEGR